MLVSNESGAQLDLQRLSLHVEHLSVYDAPKQLWTNGVQVRFRGDEQIAQIGFDEQPPQFEPVGDQLSQPRVIPGRSLFKRTFGNFKIPWA